MQSSSFRFSSHQRTDHDIFFSGQLQLKFLDETDVIALLPTCLPDDWQFAQQVIWYPGNSAKHHPPKEWLNLVWRYLVDHFDELDVVEGLPLIPVDMSEDEVTLARLCCPSSLILQKYPHGTLDGTVAGVLENLGMTVINKLPNWVRSHPSIHYYVCTASVHSVLQAMETQFSTVYEELEERLQRQSDESKRALRSFIARVSGKVSKEIKELIQHLPLFETRGCGASKPSRFVTAREICTAAPPMHLPVEVLHELIDVRQEDSLKLARLAGVRVLTFTDLLKLMVFEDVRKGRYPEEDVDRLMKHVFDHYSEYRHEIADTMRCLPFVPKSDGERVKPSDLFDGTVRSLRDIFVGEDVFPCGQTYTCPVALDILRELGLKKEDHVTAYDFLQSVRHVEKMYQVEKARSKARALLVHLNDNPSLMGKPVYCARLGEIITRHPWIPTTTRRPPSYPQSLPFCIPNDVYFLKPTEVTSYKFVYVSGSVKPVVHIEGKNLANIANAFGWTKPPTLKDVVTHLRQVVEFYDRSEKEIYMGIVKHIYSHLQQHPNAWAILSALREERWIWNGNGFSSPGSMVIEKPSIELSPYICPLPSEVKAYKALFIRGGMVAESQQELLLKVLGLIKEKYDKMPQRHSMAEVRRDLKLSIIIVNELKPKPGGPCLDECIKERLLIPTKVANDSSVRLLPVEDCTYCDEEWLKQGHDASDVDEDGDVQIEYVHQDISQDTAESLGVPSLMSRMLDADELDVAENFGQEEPLTRSIHRLLEGYTDGFAVPKELIQNADDAGATEVKFLYDERSNKDSLTCLFDKGMEACQGPALWAYNNAVFTDDDFTNITKLNGATKEGDTGKIGKFGSGFNAVYNLTDVPSFVSRDSFVIFDPHRTHLGKAVKNGKPGIRIDLRKNKQKLRKLANQFKPFNRIFGCDLSSDAEGVSYNGTLFRFPLRTREQARKSELKDLHYDDKEMRELLEKLVEGAELLLQFTQTVQQVSVYHLQEDSPGAPEPRKLFEVKKKGARMMAHISLSSTPAASKQHEQRFEEQFKFLKASSLALKLSQSPDGFPRSSLVIDIEMKYTDYGRSFFSRRDSSESSSWLISSAMGTEEALQIAKKDKTLVPTGGVSIRLQRGLGNVFTPAPVNGKVFCFLPLPLPSGMPVHVNGFFAVASDRRHLKEKTDDDKHRQGDDWNEALLDDAISNAYVSALVDLKSLLPANERCCDVYKLWPRMGPTFEMCPSVCHQLGKSFYRRLLNGGPESPALFTNGEDWTNIDTVVFLDPKLRRHPEIGDVAFQVFKALLPGSILVDLPYDVLKSIEHCGLELAIKKRTVHQELFYQRVLLPKLAHIEAVKRDCLVLHALDEGNLRLLLKGFPCIPVFPGGGKLRSPEELVHPHGKASSLYGPEDGVFPHGTNNDYLKSSRLDSLTELGMRKDHLSWEELVERAGSVQVLSEVSRDHSRARQRGKALIHFMNQKLTPRQEEWPGLQSCMSLTEAKFLPVLPKTPYFPAEWKGDEYGPNALLAPKDFFLEKVKNLVSCSHPILDDSSRGCGPLSEGTKTLLGLQGKVVPLEVVQVQLNAVIASDISLESSANYEAVKEVLHSLYRYLQNHLDKEGQKIVRFLIGKRFILGKSRFLHAKEVAFRFHTGLHPYLYELPERLGVNFHKLMAKAGVPPSFRVEDYQRTLRLIKDKFDGSVLDNETVDITVRLASLIDGCVKQGQPLNKTELYLPDTSNRLYPISELCMKDCHWMPDKGGVTYVHEGIPVKTCANLGVRTRRQETLSRCSFGIAFGQREKLTNRIKRLLTAYPCEDGLLKELLQNADDAQATELCFIKDARQHGAERVFEDSWKPLQGPALCVYNNKPFTGADLRGIQNLGEGSKGDDPNKTGQYGVGFNAVYHLTDVPSFLSKGSEIGEVLCAFDPQCKYVPGANDLKPGQMFIEDGTLRRTFTDVFLCYLGEHFPIENSTMFRFPLRTPKMAEESLISKTPMTVEGLQKMMDKFREEMFETLLFVKSVGKITLCEVGKGGRVARTYEVTATLSKEDARKRREFSDHVTNVGRQLRDGKMPLTKMSVKESSYVVHLQDNKGYQERWLVVQRIGFDPGAPVSDALLGAFRSGDLSLLPRGGAAVLLDRTPSSFRKEKPTKAFCFLPLPFETNLPVHINGHFALDHEARRGLWRDSDGGYRSDWNNTLLREVIAPCYVSLLATVREHLQLPVDPGGGTTLLKCEEKVAHNRIARYLALFPRCFLDDPYWCTLSKGVYHYVHRSGKRLLPVLRKTCNPSNAPSQSRETNCSFEITWLPSNGQGKHKAYFDNLSQLEKPSRDTISLDASSSNELRHKQIEDLRAVLLQAGFNLIKAPLTFFNGFKASGLPVECISPGAVLTFFKSYSTPSPLCRLGKLPQPLKNTVFGDVMAVVSILSYARWDKSFEESLQGLPLLVTEDRSLGVFDSSSPVFLTEHVGILPQSASKFVHHSLVRGVFYGVDPSTHAVFKDFDVDSLARHLHRDLPASTFCTGNQYVNWNPNKDQVLASWIRKVWHFLSAEARSILQKRKIDSSEKRRQISAKLSPLNEWCLLPVTETSISKLLRSPAVHSLVPIGMAHTVVQFDSPCSLTKDALKALRLPELNRSAIDVVGSAGYIVESHPSPAQVLVASLSDPSLVLQVLQQKWLTSAFDRLPVHENCIQILQYFNEHSPHLNARDADVLRMLPLYLASHGRLTDLARKKVFVLPSSIPREGMDRWGSKEVVFLEEIPSLANLHKFLGCTSRSEIDIYCEYILEHFQDLTSEDRLVHLKYLRDKKLPFLGKPDRNRLLEVLEKLRFMPSRDGSMRSASCFFDPQQPVFREMLSADAFPPDPFSCPDKWLPFLRQIGLVKVVSPAYFVYFAEHVAEEAQRARSERTKTRSEVLLKHLFQRQNVATEGLLERIRQIPFIHPHKVPPPLSNVYPQYGTVRGVLPYICFEGAVSSSQESISWTSVNLLPWNADPTRISRYQVNFGYERSSPLDAMVWCLSVLQEPTVDDVTSHFENLCIQWKKRSCPSVLPERHVVRAIYDFLSRHRSQMEKSRLRNVPCILVDDRLLARPNQIVEELMKNDEIKPYLMKAPSEFGQFFPLFSALGSSKVATADQYAMVLMEIHKAAEGAKLEPNEVRKSFQAVKGFFTTLETGCAREISVPVIYLPGAKREQPIRVFMRPSSELVFDDAPHFRDRVTGFEELFLVDLKQCGLEASNYESVVNRLPENVRPQMLTSLVQECLSEPVHLSHLEGPAGELECLLASQYFSQAIVRLIRHEDHSTGRKTGQRDLETIKQHLGGIRVHGVQGLQTHLVFKGEIVSRSQEANGFFATLVDQTWNVYLDSANLDTTWVVMVADIVNKITGGLLGDTKRVLPVLLTTSPRQLCSCMDAMKIREDRTFDSDQASYLPEPGAFIHVEDHYLLKDSFEDFEPGEYVGYELSDPGLEDADESPTYVYARIIEEVEAGAAQGAPFLKRYRVDIGRAKIEVDAVDLYKFRRIKGAPCWDMVPYEGEETDTVSAKPEDLDEVMDRITETLEEAWKLPKDKRDKIIRRLYLTWHPDKNPGNEEFCTKVFQYLQSEIARIERGEPRRPRKSATASGFTPESYYASSYSSYFRGWNNRARSHRQQRNHFYDSRGTSGPCGYRPNPQPQEARRWFRQAKADLQAVAKDLNYGNGPSHEWACFKCHQVTTPPPPFSPLPPHKRTHAHTHTHTHTYIRFLCPSFLGAFNGLCSHSIHSTRALQHRSHPVSPTLVCGAL